jgi:hypothetical protein
VSRPANPVEEAALELGLRLDLLEGLGGRRVGLATMSDPDQDPDRAELLALYIRGRGTCEPVPPPLGGPPHALFLRLSSSQVEGVLRWRRDQVLEESTGCDLEDLDPGQVVREALELALELATTRERRAILEGALEGIADLEGEELLLLDVTRCACAGCGQAARVEDYNDDDPDLCPACGDVLVPVEELEDDLEEELEDRDNVVTLAAILAQDPPGGAA